MHIRTPLLKSFPLSKKLGAPVWLKMEALQPSGSFKLRGMGRKAEAEARRGARRFISSSGGNAGLAVAYAGQELGIPVRVYVPNTTSADMVRRLEMFAAKVIVGGAHWAEAHAEAVKELSDPTVAYFHPFDDDLVWDGHASLVDELARDDVSPDLMVCSVGGGGLLCGIMTGIARNGMGGTKVLAVETDGADSLDQSRRQGSHITLDRITSRAKSLGATRICDQAFAYLANPDLVNCVVTDEAAEEACDRFLHDHRVKVELACGAALCPLYQAEEGVLREARELVVVVCGGVGD